MRNDDKTVEIQWPAGFDASEQPGLQDIVLALDGALTALEADARAVFASDADRSAVYYGFQKRWGKAKSKPGPCMFDGCKKTSIARSHTISLGTSIRLIAEDNHVLTPRFGEGHLELVPEGIRNASTFPGFCATHETMFAGFESQKTIKSEQDFRLQGFRTICREIHSKNHQVQRAEDMLSGYRRRREPFVRERILALPGMLEPPDLSALKFEHDARETKMVKFLADARADVQELQGLSASMLDEIQNGADAVATLAMDFNFQLPVCLSGFGVLNYKDGSTASSKRALCMVAILPEVGRTKLLLIAAREHATAIQRYAQGLGSFAVLEMLESWMVHGSDHWFISPSAWNRIPFARQHGILDRIAITHFSLGDLTPFSILDDARQTIIAHAEAELAAGKVNVANVTGVVQTLAAQKAKLNWTG